MLNQVWELHLRVLKFLLNQKKFDWIKNKLKDEFDRTDYIEIITKSGNLSFNEGKLIGAYPIAPFISNYKITVNGIGQGYSMCAIDALGIAYTFNSKTKIEAIDQSTDNSIIINIDPRSNTQISKNLFVSYKNSTDELQGERSSALVQCPKINFYSIKNHIPDDLKVMDFESALNYAKKRFSPDEFKVRISNAVEKTGLNCEC